MPLEKVNGVELFYESDGDGYPLVLVHGSWSDHFSWLSVVPDLAKSFRVISYDRRGHGASEKPGEGTRRDDEDDLAGLIEALDIAPAHVAGNSFGAATTLSLVARRPELFRAVIGHEPPLMGIVDDPDARKALEENRPKIDAVLDRIRSGDSGGGARLFVEEVAMGPGVWDTLPEPMRHAFENNALTFLNEQSDPEWSVVDLDGLSRFPGPVLLTSGDQSPVWFSAILDKLGATMKKAQRRTYAGAGHVPHVSHPEDYVNTVTDFIRSSA
jgi:pimeloyl-ACP methyl ester carboxylesterase